MSTWRHVFKLDPERTISDQHLQWLCESGSDAIIVGGSSGVTLDNTIDLLTRIRRFALPCVLEVSNIDAIVPGFDYYCIPVVLNTDDMQWVTGYHHEAIKAFGTTLPWHMMVAEGYIIMNAQSTVAKVTGARTVLSEEDVLAYAKLAERLFQFPIVYLEYSGTFGQMDLVKRVAQSLERAQLFYGGGIDSLEKAEQAAAVAHTIVVGNVIYDDITAALQTVKINEQTY